MIREFNIKDISDEKKEISVCIRDITYWWVIDTKQLEEFIETGNFNVVTNKHKRDLLEKVLCYEYFYKCSIAG